MRRIAFACYTLFLLLAACTSMPRESPVNPYVDGPGIIAQANYLIGDLVGTGVISPARAKELSKVSDQATASIALARQAAGSGDATAETANLQLARESLITLRTFTKERK